MVYAAYDHKTLSRSTDVLLKQSNLFYDMQISWVMVGIQGQ